MVEDVRRASCNGNAQSDIAPSVKELSEQLETLQRDKAKLQRALALLAVDPSIETTESRTAREHGSSSSPVPVNPIRRPRSTSQRISPREPAGRSHSQGNLGHVSKILQTAVDLLSPRGAPTQITSRQYLDSWECAETDVCQASLLLQSAVELLSPRERLPQRLSSCSSAKRQNHVREPVFRTPTASIGSRLNGFRQVYAPGAMHGSTRSRSSSANSDKDVKERRETRLVSPCVGPGGRKNGSAGRSGVVGGYGSSTSSGSSSSSFCESSSSSSSVKVPNGSASGTKSSSSSCVKQLWEVSQRAELLLAQAPMERLRSSSEEPTEKRHAKSMKVESLSASSSQSQLNEGKQHMRSPRQSSLEVRGRCGPIPLSSARDRAVLLRKLRARCHRINDLDGIIHRLDDPIGFRTPPTTSQIPRPAGAASNSQSRHSAYPPPQLHSTNTPSVDPLPAEKTLKGQLGQEEALMAIPEQAVTASDAVPSVSAAGCKLEKASVPKFSIPVVVEEEPRHLRRHHGFDSCFEQQARMGPRGPFGNRRREE